MKSMNVLAIIFLAAGTLSLIYGGFTYTRDVNEVDLGFVELEVVERDRVNLPVWFGVGLIVIGSGVLLGARRR